MASKLDDSPPASIESHAGAAGRPGGSRMRLIAVLIVVMAGEAALMYFFLHRGATPPAASEAQAEEPTGLDAEMTEVSVGQFQCTNSVAAPGSIVHITFELSATVARGRQSEAFSAAVKGDYKARARQAIVQVIRSSSMDDLKDPEFGVIKRQLREELNKTLRKSFVNEIIVSDFRLIEQ